MKAALVDHYGAPEVVRVAETPRPEPRADEVLVRVAAAAVTSADARIRGGRFPTGFGFLARLAFGMNGPRRRVLGSTFSGVVDSAGTRVDSFEPGDQVCGMTGAKLGAHAEYVAVAAKRLTRKPAAVSHDDAAGVLFGGTTALFFLRDRASVGPGTSVLVNGASGAVGTNAVQLARHLGATVTGVTSSGNAALVTALGADEIIDHTECDLSAIAARFDVVLDTVGTLTRASGRRLLRPDGVLVLAVASLKDTILARGNLVRRDVVAGAAPERVADFDLLLHLVAEGEMTVVQDQSCELDGIVDAYRRVDSGRKVGNIVVHP